MTPQQIQQFKTKAKALGKSDTQINAFIEQKTKEREGKSFTLKQPQEGALFSLKPQPEELKKDGFFKSIVKGIANPFLKLGATAQALGTSKYLGGKGTDNTPKNVPGLGQVKPITKASEALGVGAELASFAVGGAGKNLLKEGLKRTVIQGTKTGAAVGGLSSLGTSLQKDNKTFGGVVKDTALGVGSGALFGGATAPLLKPISKGLQTSAEKSYSKALGATTKANKQLSDKVVPRLIETRTKALSRTSLLEKAQKGVEETGEVLEAAYNKLPPGTRVNVRPVFDSLQKLKGQYVVKGTDQVGDDAAYTAIENMQRKLLSVSDESVSVESIRSFRQILDNATKRTGKSFALSDSDSAIAEARKATANAIRKQLAAEHPDIAKINSEFNFWSNVQTVVGETIQRTKSQNPLGGQIAAEGGAIIGATIKGTVGSVVLGAVTLKFLRQAIQSTAWRTTSALIKASLANSLAKGNMVTANILLQKIIAASQNQK